MVITTIPIEGTFDIARGRSSLRTHIAVHRWPPVFAARASAVLTAIGELVLTSRVGQVVLVKMAVIAEGEDQGIHFDLVLPTPDIDTARLQQALTRIERAADGFVMRKIGENLEISAQVSVKERVVGDRSENGKIDFKLRAGGERCGSKSNCPRSNWK
jgi:hypothetical protein